MKLKREVAQILPWLRWKHSTGKQEETEKTETGWYHSVGQTIRLRFQDSVLSVGSCSTAFRLGVAVGLILACPVRGAEEPLVLPVWPGAVPGDYGTIGPERVRAPSEAPTKNAKWITNVTRPALTVFRPTRDKNTGAAMIICPGGGYWNLAWDLEGEEVAAWLNTVGVTGVVLKYRVPRRPDQPERLPAPGPLLDAQRAVSLVRSRAAEWGIDPNRIGIAGFSAGGVTGGIFRTGGVGAATTVRRNTTIRPKKPTKRAATPNPVPKPMPVFSPSVSGRPRPPVHGAGGAAQLPSAASCSGTENIASRPYTIARPATK